MVRCYFGWARFAVVTGLETDNPINQNILSTFMKKKKIKFDVAKNGEEAVQKWRSGVFHLILVRGCPLVCIPAPAKAPRRSGVLVPGLSAHAR